MINEMVVLDKITGASLVTSEKVKVLHFRAGDNGKAPQVRHICSNQTNNISSSVGAK